ncbi:MAG: glycosyltransferase [Myxococcales bacterium]|nr:glycosyltransferase [Myxococcales bacterium]
MSRGLTFEFEDVIAECDDRVRIDSRAIPTEKLGRKVWRAGRAAALLANRSKASRGDELVFATAQVMGDLADHLAFQSEIRSAAKSAAFIEELWIRDIPLRLDLRRLLELFDHVFVSCAATVGPLAEHLGKPVTYLPPSVDHDRFAATPWPPTSIDVYAMGRRQPALHEALVRWTEADRSRFYLFDTFVGNVPIADHKQHREKLADLIRRSRYFLVNGAKVDRSEETGAQSELGYRFFEGAAAGAVMIGTAVDAPVFGELFTWAEPAIVVDPSGDDIVHRMSELDEQPERRASIRHRNASGSLRAHDPAHRWRTVLKTLGLEEPRGVAARIDRLAKRAEAIDLSATE